MKTLLALLLTIITLVGYGQSPDIYAGFEYLPYNSIKTRTPTRAAQVELGNSCILLGIRYSPIKPVTLDCNIKTYSDLEWNIEIAPRQLEYTLSAYYDYKKIRVKIEQITYHPVDRWATVKNKLYGGQTKI